MKTVVLIGLVVLMPLMVMAQNGTWQSMNGPYYVYNVTGISIGYYNNQTYAYAIASDLTHNYIYSYQGNSPIGQWGNINPAIQIDGIRYLSTCRNDGQFAYASIPQGGEGTPGVYKTAPNDPWRRTNSQPGNLQFTGIETHPGNGQICFTASSAQTIVSTIYNTSNSGTNWNPVAPPSSNDCVAIHIDPNSGNTLSNTTVYACFSTDGIYRSTNGGANWGSRIDIYGDGLAYDGLSVAVKKVEDQPDMRYIYAITSRNSDHSLWKSIDNGQQWDNNPDDFNDLYPDPGDIFKVTVDELYDPDFVNYHFDRTAVVSPDHFYWLRPDIQQENPRQFWDDRSFDFPNNLANDMAFDAFYSGPNDGTGAIYFGQKFGIHSYCHFCDGYTQGSFWYNENINGTNKADAISIDHVEGSGLMSVSRQGGFISEDSSIKFLEAASDDWNTLECFIGVETASLNTEGRSIAAYYENGAEHVRYISCANDESGGYLIYNGQPPSSWDPPHDSLFVVEGDNVYATTMEIAFAGGISEIDESTNNVIWYVSQLQEDDPGAGLWYNIGSQPPNVLDLLYENGTYACGQRGETGDIVIYCYPGETAIPLNGGLSNVHKASSIVKSREISEGLQIPSALYLGTESGIYKNKFDRTQSSDWYPANYGIEQNTDIKCITNYYQTITNNNNLKPDSIVQYALGQLDNESYIYISADSGRSWNEIGQYFRESYIHVNDLATFSDRRPNLGPMPVFLGAGTDNGVYRYPYNVKSGELTSDELPWGPGLVIVNGDVIVPPWMSLTINPGTTVMFLYNYDRENIGSSAKAELIVEGTLNAIGEVGQPIVLKSSHPFLPLKGQWYGIRVLPGGVVNMQNCQVKHSEYGLNGIGSAAISISNCLFDSILTAGIYMDNTGIASGNYEISSSRIQNCGSYGIYWKENSFIASFDTIINNSYGIYYSGDSDPHIENCLITYPVPSPGSYYGIYSSKIIGGNSMVLVNDSISGYGQGGVYFYGVSTDGSITKTKIASCGTYGIYYSKSNAPIGGPGSVNLLKGNIYGLWMTNLCSPKVRRTKFWENSSRGAYVELGCRPDFGRDLTGEYGENSFKRTNPNPGYYDLYNNDPVILSAEWCYWGEPNPWPWQMRNVDYNPYFDYERLPRLAPPTPEILPADLETAQIYPNPFNPSATVRFSLQASQQVSIRIYNIMGQEVRSLFQGEGEVGENVIVWDGTNDLGQSVSAGVYFCRVSTEEAQKTVKMTVLK